MRKLLIGLIAVLLFSCTLSHPNDTVLINNSDREVAVYLAGASRVTIPAGESRTVSTRTDMNPIQRLQRFSPDKRVLVSYNNSTLTFEFRDRESFYVTITQNSTGQAGILSAGGWTEPDEIPFDQSGRVYTPRPRFIAILADGSELQPRYTRDDNGNFLVTIGN